MAAFSGLCFGEIQQSLFILVGQLFVPRGVSGMWEGNGTYNFSALSAVTKATCVYYLPVVPHKVNWDWWLGSKGGLLLLQRGSPTH